jgi:hypothetical protein
MRKRKAKAEKSNRGNETVQYMQTGNQQTELSRAHDFLIQLSERQGPRNRLLNAKEKRQPNAHTESHTSPIPCTGGQGADTGTNQTVLAPCTNYRDRRNS